MNTTKILFLQKALFRTLFKLIRKYGIALVLQGLIEFAKQDEKDLKMKNLADDLAKALSRYKESPQEVETEKEEWVTPTWEQLIPGTMVKCVYDGYSNFENKMAIITDTNRLFEDIHVSWLDDSLNNRNMDTWGQLKSFAIKQ